MRNRNVRVVAGVAAVVAVLAVGGCGTKSADQKATSSDAASGAASGAAAAAGSARDAEGVWSARTGTKAVVLAVGGKQASLSTGEGHLCTGVVDGGGKPEFSLKCADGNTERTAGVVESNDGSTMRVTWDAGKKDTFKKSENGKLPDVLPTSTH
ncbi:MULTISPECIES: hypothetical protein [unclassified Streptomyces]|uniref:hypothetical protein n=1 Tax=unclassified Streptomyces TaxID=2593676 RepID=UPI00278C15C6|nr:MULTISPECIES: hypothetical protein [unclassified Streptomyces]